MIQLGIKKPNNGLLLICCHQVVIDTKTSRDYIAKIELTFDGKTDMLFVKPDEEIYINDLFYDLNKNRRKKYWWGS